MDLARWWRDRRWRALLELIDELPTASRFNEALVNDPEYAELLVQLPRPVGKWAPRYAEYDLHAQLLAEIREAVVSGSQWTQLGATGKKPKPVPMLPPPQTELERAEKRLRETAAMDMFRTLTPNAMPRTT